MEENQILQAIKELQNQMNEGFQRLELRIENLEEGQESIKDQMELFVQESWEQKNNLYKLKKRIRQEQS